MTTTNEYKCTICKDTGYVDDFYGNIANTCECAVQRAINARTQLWITESNTTTLDRERFTFDNFKPEKQLTKKGINDAKMLIKLLKSWQEREIKLLTIIGGVGIGKTHLSIATLVNTIQTKCEQGYYAPATEIAVKLNIKGTSSYVRVSQLKRQAIHKLIDNVDHSQVLDFV